ncbi:MAG: oxidoreductase, partial [Blastocatellia bacterium]|nr:oxidoreductase [Blastocatellia bacterium]
GGGAARVFRSTDAGKSWQVAATPIAGGQPSAGIFSIAFKDAMNGVIVGGDYKKESEARDNAAMTSDGGRTWNLSKGSLPGGYRSGVAYVARASATMFITVGPSGSDYSVDGGANWRSFGSSGYDAVSFARSGAGWAVGEGGRIGKSMEHR